MGDKNQQLLIGGKEFAPGESGVVDIHVGNLVTHDDLHLSVHVRRGEKPGPRLLLTAALHGDEINGVEILRQVLRRRILRKLRGDLIVIPIVNEPAFVGRSRYMPDRRDLNRLFPGSKTGSLGSKLARALSAEVAPHCTHGIDFHTGAVNRPNLPQIRICADVSGTADLARAFGAPAVLDAPVRPGSFREVFHSAGKPMLMFEGGEADVLDPATIRIGVRGVLSVMRQLGMLPGTPRSDFSQTICSESWWERAPCGGLFKPVVEMGKTVEPETLLGMIADPFGGKETQVLAQREGIVIGRAKQAVVDEGDGLFHVAWTERLECVVETVAADSIYDDQLDQPVFDDPMSD
ncbi:MAG: putative deacylase [Verrucomicrobiales bacterium]|jgi:predicted deacylase